MSVEFIENLKRQWLAMIDAVADPLAIVSRDYRVLRLNRAYTEAAHAKLPSIPHYKGTRCYEVFAGRQTPCPACKLESAFTTNTSQSWMTDDLRTNRKIEVKVEPLPPDLTLGNTLSSNINTMAVVHYRDFTNTWLLQEKLAQADKLTALGTLASGVAHEINSPLAGILAFTQMLLSETAADDPHLSDLKEIEDAARKCRSIVESLLALGRSGISDKKSLVNVTESLASTLRLASPMLKKYRITLREQNTVPANEGLVWGHPVRLGQVFLNLVTNAVHAMRDTGGDLCINANLRDDRIVIDVIDAGPGIAPDVLPRIFDPFFTTKPTGEGTGLGLSIAYQICSDHFGTLSVVSQAGHGAHFTVELPLFRKQNAPQPLS